MKEDLSRLSETPVSTGPHLTFAILKEGPRASDTAIVNSTVNSESHPFTLSHHEFSLLLGALAEAVGHSSNEWIRLREEGQEDAAEATRGRALGFEALYQRLNDGAGHAR